MDFNELTKLTLNRPFTIERVRLTDTGIAIEGDFELPQLTRLTAEDQVFVAAFVRCHGSIKQMEQYFGVSYPTIKNRLNRIGEQLDFVEIEPVAVSEAVSDKSKILKQLEDGELTVAEALERLNKGVSHE